MTTHSGGTDDLSVPGVDSSAPTVLCPQGHVNNWDYKFCGQCGAPIGVVAWPSDEDATHAQGQRGSSRLPLVAGIIGVVLVVVLAGLIAFVLGRSDHAGRFTSQRGPSSQRSAESTSAVPESCSTAPDVQPESIDMTPEGLQIKVAFSSPCGEDVETNSALVITAADGRRDVAAAEFDFSVGPMAIARGGPTHRTLLFPHGMYWRTTDMLAGTPTMVAKRQGSSNVSARQASNDSSTMTATKAAQPAHGSADDVAGEVLEELRDAALPTIRRLLHTWVPQISSKKVGLVANGKTWSNPDILVDHLRLRQHYPGVRLVWSGQWTSFSSPNFWVTIVGTSFRSPVEANGWCDAQGFAVDDCFAKFISPVLGEEGTTVYRK